MDVRMPDGTVITNVPEGTTQTELLRRLELAQQPQQPAQEEPSTLRGALDLAGTVATGAVAEPAAGLAGLLAPGLANITGAVNRRLGVDVPELDQQAKLGLAAQTVQDVRGGLTAELGPQGQALVQRGLEAVPESVRGVVGQGVENFERSADFLGERSPAAGAALRTLPAAAGALTGLRGGKTLLSSTRNISRRGITKALDQAAPSVDDLKDAAGSIFKEVSESGVVVKQDVFDAFSQELKTSARRLGVRRRVAGQARDILDEASDLVARGDVPIDDLVIMRQVATNAAGGIDKPTTRAALALRDDIDDFLGTLKPRDLVSGSAEGVAERLTTARGLWRRAASSEVLEEAFKNAELTASGFENGVRVQLRQILKSKKRRNFFTREEQDLMREIVAGTKGQNFAKLVGRFGFSEGGATNILGGAAGAGIGFLAGGPPGAVIVPVVGQVSRSLAGKMIRGSAEYLDDVVRAGPNARRIVRAYFKHTPKAQRSSEELAELLMRPSIDIQRMPIRSRLIQGAISIATNARAAGEAAAGGAIVGAGNPATGIAASR